MIKIEVGQRWVCIKNINLSPKYRNNAEYISKYFFKRFDVIDIVKENGYIRCIKNEDELCIVSLTTKELLDNFITKAEWRDEQINLILDDEN